MNLINFLQNLYVYFFSKRMFYFLNKSLLHLTLKCLGYKNHGSFFITGEKYLINKLREFNIRLSLDIGAHHGLYSKLLLEKTQSKVIAFEPFKENCKKIKNLNKNNIGRISIKEIALSNERKIKKIYFFNKQSQLSSLINDINKFTYNKNKKLRYMKIKTDKLDNCIDKELKNFKSKIDLIKVDTEGHEYEVLLGAEKTIKKHKPKFIQIEMNWHNLFSNKNIFSFSKILNNYKFYIILPFNSGLRKIEANSPNNNIYHLSNFLCVRNDIIKFF